MRLPGIDILHTSTAAFMYAGSLLFLLCTENLFVWSTMKCKPAQMQINATMESLVEQVFAFNVSMPQITIKYV